MKSGKTTGTSAHNLVIRVAEKQVIENHDENYRSPDGRFLLYYSGKTAFA